MNYRHAFHAGNHADVLKHIVLLALIDALKHKETPFFVLDTHAGRGRYLLGGHESRRTGEAEGGIFKLISQPGLPAVVERYLRAVEADNPVGAQRASPSQKAARPCAGIQIKHYPGSPLLAAQAMRAQDRLAACELQPEEAAELKALFAHDPHVAVHMRDGYAAIRALLPPKSGDTRLARGLVLIDPPYEAQDEEYPRVLAAIRDTLERWPAATLAVWYPIKQRRSLRPFHRKIAHLPCKSAWTAELLIRPDDSPLRLNGSGMLLVNPPWQLDTTIAGALPALQALLGEAGASSQLEWMKREA